MRLTTDLALTLTPTLTLTLTPALTLTPTLTLNRRLFEAEHRCGRRVPRCIGIRPRGARDRRHSTQAADRGRGSPVSSFVRRRTLPSGASWPLSCHHRCGHYMQPHAYPLHAYPLHAYPCSREHHRCGRHWVRRRRVPYFLLPTSYCLLPTPHFLQVRAALGSTSPSSSAISPRRTWRVQSSPSSPLKPCQVKPCQVKPCQVKPSQVTCLWQMYNRQRRKPQWQPCSGASAKCYLPRDRRSGLGIGVGIGIGIGIGLSGSGSACFALGLAGVLGGVSVTSFPTVADCLLTYLLTYLLAYFLTCLPTYLLTFQLACLLTYRLRPS